ncbi:serine hydrolase domain-containing protein [Propioniciclava soli]|uniref:serine hydrolase domain-containing protein n=1 Tax=Propioniciclava soli TaxID=2775081 RepID=UPI001E45E7EB
MDLSRTLETLRAARRQPSLSAALSSDGDVTWADAVGDADPLGVPRRPDAHTQYRIASITKPQVAVALCVLADAGAVDLHRPLATWVPDAPGGDATVAQFLAHTSGLPAEPPGPWWERAGGTSWDALAAADLQPLFPAGTRFHYSNLGYGVLGRLLETLTGQAWDAALADLVWRPLGMTHTARTPAPGHAVGVGVHPREDLVHPEPVPDYLALGAAGELWSTPTDLVRLGAFLAGAIPGVLRPATRATMLTPIAWPDVAGEPFTTAHGLGVMVVNDAGRRTYGHAGSVPGFTADLRIDAERRLAVAVCGNATTPFGGAFGLLAEACAAAVNMDGPVGPGDATAADLCGVWYWGTREHVLAAPAPGRLLLVGADGKGASHFAGSGDRWTGDGGDYFHGEPLVVHRDAHGRPRTLEVATFCFTRTPYDPEVDLPGGPDPDGWRPLTL